MSNPTQSHASKTEFAMQNSAAACPLKTLILTQIHPKLWILKRILSQMG
jgi:hypothetical protein